MTQVQVLDQGAHNAGLKGWYLEELVDMFQSSGVHQCYYREVGRCCKRSGMRSRGVPRCCRDVLAH